MGWMLVSNILIVSFLLLLCENALSTTIYTRVEKETKIVRIYIDTKDVFDLDTTTSFIEKTANSLHSVTSETLIRSALTFTEGDEYSDYQMESSIKILQEFNLFSSVKIEVDTLSELEVDIYVVCRDRQSLLVEALHGSGGTGSRSGARVSELNLFGAGIGVSFQYLFVKENNEKDEFSLQLTGRMAPYWAMSKLTVVNNAITEKVELEFTNEGRVFADKSISSGNVIVENSKYFDYSSKDVYHKKSLVFGLSYNYQYSTIGDPLFVGIGIGYIKSQIPERFATATDNIGYTTISFSSIKRQFLSSNSINSKNEKLENNLSQGSVSLSVLRQVTTSESVPYVSAVALQTWISKDTSRMFVARVRAGSGFRFGQATLTGLEVTSTALVRMTPTVSFVSRFELGSRWNWNSYHQLVVDNDGGVRGLTLNSRFGVNKASINSEIRWFPQVKFWILSVAPTAFLDIGSTWNRGEAILATRWNAITGFGLRFENSASPPGEAVLRVDWCYDLHKKKSAGFSIGSGQYFSPFLTLQLALPLLVGQGVDLR